MFLILPEITVRIDKIIKIYPYTGPKEGLKTVLVVRGTYGEEKHFSATEYGRVTETLTFIV